MKTSRAIARDRRQNQTKKGKRKMNPRKLMAVALCAAACVTTTTYAEDKQAGDAPFESAAATPIPDPVNPKPGMLFNGYNFGGYDASKLSSALKDIPAVVTAVDTADTFSLPSQCRSGVWEGFLKCKLSAKCTVLVEGGNPYALYINGQTVAIGQDLTANHVDLKAGFNHIKLYGQSAVHVSIKVAESTREPKPMSPKDLFYDEKPDVGDVF